MASYSICTQTFDIGDEPKAKALKPLEEAAEVFGAWQNRCDEDVVDELADCIQACANMMAWMGLTQQDVDNAMLRCLKRNRDRGRIDAPWLAQSCQKTPTGAPFRWIPERYTRRTALRSTSTTTSSTRAARIGLRRLTKVNAILPNYF